MNKELTLRNVFATYKKVNNGTKNEVYYDEFSNSYIVFCPFDNCDTDSICNGISNDPYMYLVKVLNSQRNVIVVWSQIDGTTSDYTIYYDIALQVQKPTYKEIMSHIKSMTYEPKYGWKYTFIKSGKEYPIRREDMF